MHNMKKLRNAMIVISVPILILAFLILSAPMTQITSTAQMPSANAFTLSEKTNSENGLTISATPLDFGVDKPVKFDIKFDTHQGSLDFDIVKVSALEDSNGIAYNAISWDGPASGGHHMEGILTFQKLSGNPSSIKLTINNVYGVGERLFSWMVTNK